MKTERTRASIHVYNARCALTVEPSRNRAGTVHTVNLETSARPGPGTDFAWDAKLVVQVTGGELPDVTAVLLGHRKAIEFLHHGPRRDKGYRLFRDGGRFVVQVFDGSGERHSVSLADADRLALSVVLFRQLQRNHGGLPADVLYAMLERVYTRTSGPAAPPLAPEVAAPADTVPRAEPRETGAIEPSTNEDASRPRRGPPHADGPDPYDW